jgi:hypothetical protein
MTTLLTITITINIMLSIITLAAVGRYINRCKKYEQLFVSQQAQILNLAIALNQTIKSQEELTEEAGNFVTRGEVN